MRLALSMGMTVGELEQRMDFDEFQRWVAFDSEHGLPDRRHEVYSVQQAMVTVRAAGAKNVKAEDFMPFARRPDVEQKEMTAADVMKLIEGDDAAS